MITDDHHTARPGARRRRQRSRGRSALRLGAIAVALALAGCGGASDGRSDAEQHVAEIMEASSTAVAAATSVHVAIDVDGERVELSIVKGEGSVGTLSVAGLEFEVLGAGGELYIRPTDAATGQIRDRRVRDKLDGRWMLLPRDDERFAPLATFADMETLVPFNDPGETPPMGRVERVLDQDVIPIGERDLGMIYVAAEGTPWPVMAVAEGPPPAELVFSDWNEPVELPAAPAPSEIVEADELD